MKYLIQAGRFDEAEAFAKSELLEKKDWKYISRPEHIIGYDRTRVKVIQVGTFRQHPRFKEISDEIRYGLFKIHS